MTVKNKDIHSQILNCLDQFSEKQKNLSKNRKLSESILYLIEKRELKPGDRIPTESALVNRMPFSLGTIQRALRNLSELGAIKRTKGRGTVVVEKTDEIFNLWQYRFIDENANSVFPVYSHVISMDLIEQKNPWSDFLGHDETYVRIVREIDIDHRFNVYSYFYLSNSQFGKIFDFSPSELEGVHFSAIIQRKFGINTVRTNNRVVCSTIPDPVCLRLNLPSGARGLICQILGFGPNDTPISFQQVYIPADADPMEFRELKPTWSSTKVCMVRDSQKSNQKEQPKVK